MIDKTTLKQEADRLFASESYEVLWASPAGEFFTSEKLGAVSLKKGEKLVKFEKTETKELNANDSIAKIKEATSLEEIKDFEKDERKSVKSVYAWKHKQLIATIPVVGATVETGADGNEDTDLKTQI